MKNEPNFEPTDAQAQGAAMPKSSSRRQLLRAGIGASPVVLSIISQPVRAAIGDGTCRSASSFASINANAATSAAPAAQCGGAGPDNWKASFAILQDGPTSTEVGTLSGQPFASGTSITVYDPAAPTVAITSPTVRQVIFLATDSQPYGRLARCIAAARLNLAKGPGALPISVVPSDATLTGMWASILTNNSYSVNGGVNWNEAQLIAWLESTFTSA